jgi:hypothetical protein
MRLSCCVVSAGQAANRSLSHEKPAPSARSRHPCTLQRNSSLSLAQDTRTKRPITTPMHVTAEQFIVARARHPHQAPDHDTHARYSGTVHCRSCTPLSRPKRSSQGWTASAPLWAGAVLWAAAASLRASQTHVVKVTGGVRVSERLLGRHRRRRLGRSGRYSTWGRHHGRGRIFRNGRRMCALGRRCTRSESAESSCLGEKRTRQG